MKELKEENALIVKGEAAKKRVVSIVDKFVKTLPHGDKVKARTALCAKAGIVYRTFERWKAEIEHREEIGSSVYEAAEAAGYEITPSVVRQLADTKRENPGAKPEEIVKKALEPKRQPPAERVPLDTRETLVQALNQHFEEKPGDIDTVLTVLRNSPVKREELCKMCKESSTNGER